MKQVEIVGGLYVGLPILEYQFLNKITAYFKKHKVKSIHITKLNDEHRQIAQSLVKYNVMTFDGSNFSLRG